MNSPFPEHLRRAAPAKPDSMGKFLDPWTLAKPATEHAEQTALFAWAAMAARYGLAVANDPASYVEGFTPWPLDKPGCLRLLHAIPNGGLRDKATASRLKAEGARAGVPDCHLPVSRHNFLSLYIELKRISHKPKRAGSMGGRSQDQIDWANMLTEEGNCVATCYGFEEARQCLIWYLDGKE